MDPRALRDSARGGTSSTAASDSPIEPLTSRGGGEAAGVAVLASPVLSRASRPQPHRCPLPLPGAEPIPSWFRDLPPRQPRFRLSTGARARVPSENWELGYSSLSLRPAEAFGHADEGGVGRSRTKSARGESGPDACGRRASSSRREAKGEFAPVSESELPTCPSNRALFGDEAQVRHGRELKTGERIGEYVIEGKIGRGSFGTVYRAVHPLIGKQIAIKVLHKACSADPLIVSRFVTEARAVNAIRHRNIIDIFSCGQLRDGRHYHMMELLDGCTLERYLLDRGGRLTIDEALPILRGVARALDAAHAIGIAHRDLKPANVHLTLHPGDEPFPKLLDFGIAKLSNRSLPRQHETASGAVIGTPQYMSPEQCNGSNVDHRTDIYAFGVLTYQLLTGHLPFTGENTVEILWKHLSVVPSPPSALAGGLAPEIDAIVMALLEKNPADRPSSLGAAIRVLESACAHASVGAHGMPAHVVPLVPRPRSTPPVRRPSSLGASHG